MDNREKERLLSKGYTLEEIEYMEEASWLEENYWKPSRDTENSLRDIK